MTIAKWFCEQFRCFELESVIENKMDELVAQLPEDYLLPVSCASIYDCFTIDDFGDHLKLMLWFNKPSGTTCVIHTDLEKKG